jgi:hypothetical protein
MHAAAADQPSRTAIYTMGFDDALVKLALMHTGGNEELALQLLLDAADTLTIAASGAVVDDDDESWGACDHVLKAMSGDFNRALDWFLAKRRMRLSRSSAATCTIAVVAAIADDDERQIFATSCLSNVTHNMLTELEK